MHWEKYIFGLVAIIILSGCTLRQKSSRYSNLRIIQSSRSGDKLRELTTVDFRPGISTNEYKIKLDPEQTFQKIIGFGGSFTESSAHVLDQLSSTKRQEVINAYFAPDGAAYSLTRTHINSCDFSLSSYSYAPIPGDVELKHFSIKEDLNDLIPLIKSAQDIPGAKFKIIASPWTAPPWMKDNKAWFGGSLLTEYYPVWADFFVKYITSYAAQGINIWAVTVENEPLGNGANWESMHFTPQSMKEFVKNQLGPQFRQAGIESQIYIYDQNRDHVDEWIKEILNDPEAAEYIDGTAVHWYSSTFEWYPEVLSEVHNQFPDKQIIHTEGCIDTQVPVWQDDEWYWKKEAKDWGFTWAPPEDKHLHPPYVPVYRYARDIIGSLNSWLTGWVDWNLVLDTQGGPNHVSNWCIAPVIADPETDEVYYTPLFYVMSHFSKYIRPQAIRIGLDSNHPQLMCTAFRNVDGSIVVQVFNPTEEKVDFSLEICGKQVFIAISAATLQTLIL